MAKKNETELEKKQRDLQRKISNIRQRRINAAPHSNTEKRLAAQLLEISREFQALVGGES